MSKKIIRAVVSLLTCAMVFASMPFMAANADAAPKPKYNIVLDPGHGSDYSYAIFDYEGYSYVEYELNWETALYLKEILKEYPELNVTMTKNSDDKHPSLLDRVKFAKKQYNKNKKPTYLVSLHYNSRSDGKWDVEEGVQSGCMVLAPSGNYRKSVADKAIKLGENIVPYLVGLGLNENYEKTDGIYYRYSKSSKYPNGKKADYYGLIRNGIYYNIPTVIIEHAYMTDPFDAENFILSSEGIYELALADAYGILDNFNIPHKEHSFEEISQNVPNY